MNEGNVLVLAIRPGAYADHLIFDHDYVESRIQCRRDEMGIANQLMLTEANQSEETDKDANRTQCRKTQRKD